jgi:hypothetical protein
MLTF